ncbi:hypothetical protein B0919_01675 [Hymenobacter sp. CRA2]|nr:hypothetical protein B0919_01675 [Hymenobacter sp. CRA2]
MWQSTLCLGACWVFYYVVLRREACFGYNRAFLLLTPMLAALSPLLPWAQWWPVAAAVRVVGVPTAVLPVLHVGATALPESAVLSWAWVAYVGGAGGCAAVVLGRLARLWWQARQLPATAHSGYTLRLTGGQLPTSSFGRTIFWDDTAALQPDEAAQVLQHELAHVRQGHTADRLWLQLWQVALWFNPLLYLYLRALLLTHEYLADAAALRHSGSQASGYARLLARRATQQWAAPTLAHAFTTSQTLNRIAMLHHLPLTRAWRKWAIVPVASALLGLVACEQMNAFGPPPPPPPPPAPATPPPPPAPIKSANDPADRVYTYVERMPEYPGGMMQLMRDLGSRVVYPEAAKAAGLQGKVFIGFTIMPDGTLRDLRVNKGVEAPAKQQALAKQMDTAALQAVQSLSGRWQPGTQNGRPVAVAYTLPISFATK